MMPTGNVPLFGGKEELFVKYAQEVELRNRETNPVQAKRCSALVLRTDPVARESCVAVGNDQLVDTDSFAQIL